MKHELKIWPQYFQTDHCDDDEQRPEMHVRDALGMDQADLENLKDIEYAARAEERGEPQAWFPPRTVLPLVAEIKCLQKRVHFLQNMLIRSQRLLNGTDEADTLYLDIQNAFASDKTET